MSQPPAQRLLTWYERHGRDLPWRRTDDPYAIWVSEVMLQQTQVATVIPYYRRFLARFPSLSDLADASLDELLAMWQGLGYYRRARAMHQAARIMVAEHGSQLPTDPATLRSLPGIGDYTAGAVLSIAYGQDVPAVDGNVIRVMARLHDYAEDPARAAGKRFVRSAAQALLVPGQSGQSNQALMELGATVCTPKSPDCAICPLQGDCLALERGTIAQRPLRKERAPTPIVHLGAALINEGDCLLLLRRRPEGLLGGLWELPSADLPQDAPASDLGKAIGERLGADITIGQALGIIRHAYTHFRVIVRVFAAVTDGTPGADGETWDDQRWITPTELGQVGITGVTSKILAKMPWPGSDKLL